jgi:hypothetical protein
MTLTALAAAALAAPIALEPAAAHVSSQDKLLGAPADRLAQKALIGNKILETKKRVDEKRPPTKPAKTKKKAAT